jgi:adenine-specific DNA-methyltransferase
MTDQVETGAVDEDELESLDSEGAESLAKLQELLRALLQLDLADLDFGIYRLLHLKRAEIEAFLTDQLPRHVAEAFETSALADREALKAEIADLAAKIRTEIADDAILPGGDVSPQAPKAKILETYQAKREQLGEVAVADARRVEVFNHLYNFFARYYEDGDFIPRFRYGSKETYAVPSRGEEVLFHWANRDQHYVKTGEAFRDYAFLVDALGQQWRVRFVLVEATVEKDNTKGDVRYFFPRPAATVLDPEARSLAVPFEYRLPSADELEGAERGKLQENLLAKAVPEILQSFGDDSLAAALDADVRTDVDRDAGKPEISLLLKRMRHFVRRRTTDFFVHRNLRAFLERELDFYVKDQMLNLADSDAALPARRRTIKVVIDVGREIIEFLHQLEEVQRRLFEKRKFVLRTDYLVTIQQVPRSSWPEVLANESQLGMWRKVLGILPTESLFTQSNTFDESFLEQTPTLVVDTAYFDEGFRDRLVASFDDLASATDGIAVNGDNYQAATLLARSLGGGLRCVYLDPPFNTSELTFVYKNRFKHSSWLSMMCSRIQAAITALVPAGLLMAAIDDEELYDLKFLLDHLLGVENYLGTLVIETNPRGRTIDSYFATSHEYCLVYSPDASSAKIENLALTEEQKKEFNLEDEESAYRLLPFRRSGGLSTPEERPNSYYPIHYDHSSARIGVTPFEGSIEILPIDTKGKKRVWRQTRPSLVAAIERGDIVVKKSGSTFTVYMKDRIKTGRKPKTVWNGSRFDASTHGTRLLEDLFGETKLFSYPKSIHTVQQCLATAMPREEGGFVLDLFAGSGTTGHAIINLNRSDGQRRGFALVEVGSYFETVLVPRLAKVMFSPEWKGGKPVRVPTAEEATRTPRLVKILRMESYEDALHSITTAVVNPSTASAFREAAGEEKYRVSYEVGLPLAASDSMLSIRKLEHPFNYSIEILTDEGPRLQKVDLVETFNLLYGVSVKRVETWVNDEDQVGDAGRRYVCITGADPQGGAVRILWRDMTDLDPQLERAFLEAALTDASPDENRMINGDSAVPGLHSLDGAFKRLMTEELG